MEYMTLAKMSGSADHVKRSLDLIDHLEEVPKPEIEKIEHRVKIVKCELKDRQWHILLVYAEGGTYAAREICEEEALIAWLRCYELDCAIGLYEFTDFIRGYDLC